MQQEMELPSHFPGTRSSLYTQIPWACIAVYTLVSVQSPALPRFPHPLLSMFIGDFKGLFRLTQLAFPTVASMSVDSKELQVV